MAKPAARKRVTPTKGQPDAHTLCTVKYSEAIGGFLVCLFLTFIYNKDNTLSYYVMPMGGLRRREVLSKRSNVCFHTKLLTFTDLLLHLRCRLSKLNIVYAVLAYIFCYLRLCFCVNSLLSFPPPLSFLCFNNMRIASHQSA